MRKTKTLFYIDDDHDDLEFFKEAADSIEIQAILFERGDAFIRHFENAPPASSIIFLDLNMPFKSGYEIISELKKSPRLSKIPLVVYSTTDEYNSVKQCRKLGADLYIKKVTSCKDLRKIIEFTLNIDWENFIRDESTFLYKN